MGFGGAFRPGAEAGFISSSGTNCVALRRHCQLLQAAADGDRSHRAQTVRMKAWQCCPEEDNVKAARPRTSSEQISLSFTEGCIKSTVQGCSSLLLFVVVVLLKLAVCQPPCNVVAILGGGHVTRAKFRQGTLSRQSSSLRNMQLALCC